mgnify:FL=1
MQADEYSCFLRQHDKLKNKYELGIKFQLHQRIGLSSAAGGQAICFASMHNITPVEECDATAA